MYTLRVDSIDDPVQVVGAVNTITVTTDKKLVGSNAESGRMACFTSTSSLTYYTV